MVYVFLANGFEEIEAIAPIDILRRAGVEVKTVGVGGNVIAGAHAIEFVTDISVDDIILEDKLEMIVLPGGMPGTNNLEACGKVQLAIDYCTDNEKYVAAICAAPKILGAKGLLNGKNAICFPGFEDSLTGAYLSDELVVTDGKIITAKGAGVAVEFGLKLVEMLVDAETSDKLKSAMQCR